MKDADEVLDVDICIGGTGMIECLIASSLASRGFKVVHFDSADFYGGNHASLSFKNLLRWSADDETNFFPIDFSTCNSQCNVEKEEAKGKNLKSFNTDGILKSSEKNNSGNDELLWTSFYLENGDYVIKQISKNVDGKLSQQKSNKQDLLNTASFVKNPSCFEEKAIEFLPFVKFSDSAKKTMEYETIKKTTEERKMDDNQNQGKSEVNHEEIEARQISENNCGEEPEEVKKVKEILMFMSNDYFIDILPKFLFSKSNMVDLLIKGKVSKYLEFRSLDEEILFLLQTNKKLNSPTPFVQKFKYECKAEGEVELKENNEEIEGHQLCHISSSKSSIFTNKILTLNEKRILMKFINFIMKSNNVGLSSKNNNKYEGSTFNNDICSNSFPDMFTFCSDPEKYFSQFLASSSSSLSSLASSSSLSTTLWLDFLKSHNLDSFLKDCLSYGICLGENDVDKWKAMTGIIRMYKFMSSLGVYSHIGPYIYPIYGNGEISQALSRVCALREGVYILRCSISKLVFTPFNLGSNLEDTKGNHFYCSDDNIGEKKQEVTGIREAIKGEEAQQQEFLRKSKKSPNNAQFPYKLKFLELTNGLKIKTKLLISTFDHLPSFATLGSLFEKTFADTIPNLSSLASDSLDDFFFCSSLTSSCRLIAIMNTHILAGKGFRSLCIPPYIFASSPCSSANCSDSCNSAIHVIQVDSSVGCSPEGFSILYLAHTNKKEKLNKTSLNEKCKKKEKEIKANREFQQKKNQTTLAKGKVNRCTKLYEALKKLIIVANAKPENCLFICSYKYNERTNFASVQKLLSKNYDHIIRHLSLKNKISSSSSYVYPDKLSCSSSVVSSASFPVAAPSAASSAASSAVSSAVSSASFSVAASPVSFSVAASPVSFSVAASSASCSVASSSDVFSASSSFAVASSFSVAASSSSLITPSPLTDSSSLVTDSFSITSFFSSFTCSNHMNELYGIVVCPDSPVTPLYPIACEPFIAADFVSTLLGLKKNYFIENNFKDFILPLPCYARKVKKKVNLLEDEDKKDERDKEEKDEEGYFDYTEEYFSEEDSQRSPSFFDLKNLEELENLTQNILF